MATPTVTVDKVVSKVSGPGWSHGPARLIVADGTGYVFTDAGTAKVTFDAADVRRSAGQGRANDVTWREHCSCRGTADLSVKLRAANARTLISRTTP